jgi:hypothetical protein
MIADRVEQRDLDLLFATVRWQLRQQRQPFFSQPTQTPGKLMIITAAERLGTELDRAMAQLFRDTTLLLIVLAGPATAPAAAMTAGVADTTLRPRGVVSLTAIAATPSTSTSAPVTTFTAPTSPAHRHRRHRLPASSTAPPCLLLPPLKNTLLMSLISDERKNPGLR